jgi:ubiquinone/menaquinone biosynthesis C-methylase UbiE
MQTLYAELGKYFDLIAESDSSVDTKKEVAFLKTVFKKYGNNVHSVLDVACGTGRHSVALAENGYAVTGIDYAEELLKVAKHKAGDLDVRFLQQDAATIRLGKQFDAAICMWSTFGELPYRQMLEGLKSVLKPGGLFVTDNRYFAKIPTDSAQKTNEIKSDDVIIKTTIKDEFRGKTRIREIIYDVNGERTADYSEMDMLTEADYIDILAEYGFKHRASYYDYAPTQSDDAM